MESLTFNCIYCGEVNHKNDFDEREIDDMHCRSCNVPYTDEFVKENFGDKFFKTYKITKEKGFLHGQLERIPYTQGAYKLEEERMDRIQKIRDKEGQINDLRTQERELRSARRQLLNRAVETERETSTLNRACPVDGCRGYLNSKWNCGICAVHVCNKCLQPIEGGEDETHECNKDDVDTAKLLASSVKPCPGCNMGITKIDGCNQVWCTACHTAFDWRTGKKIGGQIHNPHYFEWQRTQQQGGQARRNPLDIPCGGIVSAYDIREVTWTREEQQRFAMTVSALLTHIEDVELRIWPEDSIRPNEYESYRVNYMIGDITEAKWMDILKRASKKHMKNHAVNQVLRMFMMTCNDILRNTLENSENPKVVYESLKEMDALKEYANDNFRKIRTRFNNQTPHIYESWSMYPGRPEVRVPQLPFTIPLSAIHVREALGLNH